MPTARLLSFEKYGTVLLARYHRRDRAGGFDVALLVQVPCCLRVPTVETLRTSTRTTTIKVCCARCRVRVRVVSVLSVHTSSTRTSYPSATRTRTGYSY
eukprot:scaffold151870_cov27-Prasinocladus_malaysianus.AAC.2